MKKNKAFTLIEILIAIAIVGVLVGFLFTVYHSASQRSKYVEAVINVNSIGKAEEMHKTATGDYVAADNLEEINERLGLGIEPKSYTYKVVGVTNDDFIIIAQKIGDDIKSGALSPDALIVADSAGIKSDNKQQYVNKGNKKTDVEGYSDPGMNNNPGNGNPRSATPSSGNPGGGGPGYGDNLIYYPVKTPVPGGILDLLKDTASGDYFYDLINDKHIKLAYTNPSLYGMEGSLGFWMGTENYLWHDRTNNRDIWVEGNTIYIDNTLKSQGYPDSAIASIITHEATHADYAYYQQKYIDDAMYNHGIPRDQIHIPGNSIDQEYNAFNNEVNVWNSIKGTDTNSELDFWAFVQALPPPFGGEALTKDLIRALYADQNLHEF